MSGKAKTIRATGGCLCRGVRYEVTGPLRDVLACHCSQCARTSGNFVAMTACEIDDFRLVSNEALGWYRSSEAAERGFCRNCGGNLFWKPTDAGYISITAGSIDPPTRLKMSEHIYVGSK